MAALWSRGGISWPELLRRTWAETWKDEVFGISARLAFYHFLALFPALLILLLLLHRMSSPGAAMIHTLPESFRRVLPDSAAGVIAAAIADLDGRSGHAHTVFALVSAAWASSNGTWAVVIGLNKAYEVEEKRPAWKLAATVAALTFALGLTGTGALAAIAAAGRAGLSLALRWPVLALTLLFAFALLYRFGPNLPDAQVQWSTPGAVFAAALWIGCTVLFRLWLRRFDSYGPIYGALEGIAVLLLWLYLTSAAILIGGEMNSEIEKAAAGGRRAARDKP